MKSIATDTNINMAMVYIALGSNSGDRKANLDAAVKRLRAEPGVRVRQVSSYYETIPSGDAYKGQALFLNAAAAVDTELSPILFLRLMLTIEHELGRRRTIKNAPRTVDLDLLLYDQMVSDDSELTIPHPRMHERAFVLVPLAEIADDVVHPGLHRTVAELLEGINREGVSLIVPQQPLRKRDLIGQRVLITGATSGIGRAMAEAYSDAGASVIVHGRNRERAESTLKELAKYQNPCSILLADLGDPAQILKLAEDAWGDGLDILVCNAGADLLTGAEAKLPFDEKLNLLFNVDLRATMMLSREIGTKMKHRGRGVILTMGWDQAETGMAGDSGQLFAAVKGAVMCYTRSLAVSLAPEVRVNCIAPGWIRTAWGEGASADWQNRVRQETPQQIWGLPEDVAHAAVWLSTPGSQFITGQTIRVNGGAIRAS